jgi:hypothetical protein
MNEYPEAKLAFLTDPERGVWVLNVQIGEGELQRFRITKDHLFGLNSKTADILLKEFK